jgi:hypothetical protein
MANAKIYMFLISNEMGVKWFFPHSIVTLREKGNNGLYYSKAYYKWISNNTFLILFIPNLSL